MTTTQIEHGLDLGVLEGLDFEHTEACEFLTKSQPCDNKADYILNHKCCGSGTLVCDNCLFAYYKFVGERNLVNLCQVCGHRFNRGEFPYIVTRLK